MSDVDQLRELIDRYWDIAWCEGRDNRDHDTENADAQYCRSGIEAILHRLQAAQSPASGEAVEFEGYDAGLLYDWGGGNVAWWQDCIRTKIERANEHWREQVESLPLYTTPQADEWIRCEDRLPTEADADVDGNVWVYDWAMFNGEYRQTRATWWTVKDVSDYTHWMPTGLKRPQPPKEGRGDE